MAEATPTRQPKLALVALLLSGLAMLAAVVFAVGPAEPDRTIHQWDFADPVRTVPAILVAGTPERIAVSMPCRQPGDAESTISLSTSAGDDGLQISGSNGRLTTTVGGSALIDVPWREGSGAGDCSHDVIYHDGVWTSSTDSGSVLESEPGAPPSVTQFDAAWSRPISRPIRVELETRPHGSSPSAVQWFAGIVAVVCAASGAVLATRSAGERRASAARPRFPAQLRGRPRLVDVVVTTTMLGWVLIAPAFWDDWWVVSRHRAYDEVGRFTNYYTAAGAEMPFGYWNDWIAHWWTTAVTAPIALRLLPFMLIVAGWITARIALSTLAPMAARRSLIRWTLAAGYLAGSTAWLMTLRPEPLVAMLCALTLYGAAMFRRRGSLAYLVGAGAIAALALTAHPAGFVAVAPLIATIPAAYRWGRADLKRVAPLAAAILSVAAAATVLFLVDSDIGQRLSAMAEFRLGEHSETPLDEPLRYWGLTREYGGTVLRRLSVALGGLTAVAFIVRVWRKPAAVMNLAGWSLIIAASLLWLTPSKWVWHFGTLVALAAIAAAIEAGSLISSREIPLQRALIAVGSVAAATFAWGGIQYWNPGDLVTLGWDSMPLSNTPLWLWSLVFAAIVGIYARAKKVAVHRSLAIAPTLFAILGVALAIGSTSLTLIGDSVVTDGWTFTRQNAQALVGSNSCGVADTTFATMTPGIRIPEEISPNSDAADLAASQQGYEPGDDFEDGWYYGNRRIEKVPDKLGLRTYGSWPPSTRPSPDNHVGTAHSAWSRLPPDAETVNLLFAGGSPDGIRLAVQFGRLESNVVDPTDLDEVPMGPHLVEWRSETVAVPAGSNTARVVAVDDATGWGGWIAFSELFYIDGPPADLAGHLADPEFPTFVAPQLGLYFPCIVQPSIARGIAEVPQTVVHGFQPDDVFGPADSQRDYQPTSVDTVVVFVDTDVELPPADHSP